MSFYDLPDDWSTRPVTDPDLLPDLLDLFVSDRKRRRHALALLVCHDDARLVQPIVIGEIDEIHDDETRAAMFLPVLEAMGDMGALLVAVARRDGLSLRESDHAWARVAARTCRGRVRLLGVHLLTDGGVRPIPVDPVAA